LLNNVRHFKPNKELLSNIMQNDAFSVKDEMDIADISRVLHIAPDTTCYVKGNQ